MKIPYRLCWNEVVINSSILHASTSTVNAACARRAILITEDEPEERNENSQERVFP